MKHNLQERKQPKEQSEMGKNIKILSLFLLIGSVFVGCVPTEDDSSIQTTKIIMGILPEQTEQSPVQIITPPPIYETFTLEYAIQVGEHLATWVVEGSVIEMFLNPSGAFVAAIVDGSLWLYDMHSLDLVTSIVNEQFNGHFGQASLAGNSRLALSPEGKMLALNRTGVEKVEIWDTMTGEVISIFDTQDPSSSSSLIWSPDGSMLAYGGGLTENIIRIWDVATENLILLEGQNDFVNDLAWSSDSSQVASVSVDDSIRVWNVYSGEQIQVINSPSSYAFGIISIAWSPDGTKLAVGGHSYDDDALRIWDINSGRELYTLRGQYNVAMLAWSPDGSKLASGGGGFEVGKIGFWDTSNGIFLYWLFGPYSNVRDISWSPDGNELITVSNGIAQVWNPTSGLEIRRLDLLPKSVHAVAWSPDGQILASGSGDGRMGLIQLWDIDTMEEVSVIRDDELFDVRSLSWSPDGSKLASGGGYADESIRIWNPYNGQEFRPLVGSMQELTSTAWSPDGKLLASTGFDGTIRLWDPAIEDPTVESEVQVLKAHQGDVNSIAWSPDGKLLASASSDETIRLWDPTTGSELQVLEAGAGEVISVSWSPDGTKLASGHSDNTVRIWNADGGKKYLTIEGHEMRVTSLAWSPDGALIASASEDGTIRTWNSTTGDQIAVLNHSSVVNSIAWSPNGLYLASGSNDATIHIWGIDVPPD